jgi:hypothetical protein
MFKKILFLLVLALTGKLVAQNAPPDGFLYQAVVRDANGNLAANRTIYVQIAIKKTTATGSTVYADNYVVRSNADAMFSIVIGQGTNKSGTYSNLLSIPWGSDKFFFNLKLCVAPTIPGTGWTPSYRDMGTTQLWSVPYAMFANKAQSSMDSLTVTASGNTRKLKLGNYTPIYFNVADQDSSKTNEIQTISRNGGRLLLNLNGGVISLPDSSALNELQTISRTGGRITLNQGGGTISLPDSSATNELQTISKTGNVVTLNQGGGSYTDADNQTLSASGTGSNKTISISGGNSVIVNVNDGDTSMLNEIQSINQSTNKGTLTLSKNGGSIVLPDSSATNELQTISKTGSTISLSNGGGSVTDADNQNLSITAGKGTIQISGGNNIKLADSSAVNELQNLSVSSSGSNRNIGISNGNNIIVNVNDGDTSMLNEIQSISQSTNKGTLTLSKNGGSIVLPDSSAINELQTISKTGSTISLSNGGGNVTDADNQNLSITAGKGTIQISGGNNIKLADSSATNELQNLSVSTFGSNRSIGISNGNNIIVNVNDADSSATNELQTISKTGNAVTLSNGGGSITVTDNQTLSASGTGSTKTISISGGNSININVNDADSSATNELQSISQSTNKGTVTLSKNGGSILLPDSSATNELQTISKTGSTISLSNGGGSVTDADNQNLSITAGKGTIQISGGNNIKLADSSATNELQNLSLSSSGSNRNIGISNGNNIIVNVNDADSSATNELQTISKTGNTVSLSNGGGSVTVTDNQTLSASGSGSNKTISISGGNSVNLDVFDGDSSASNELQTLSQVGNVISLSKNGGSVTINNPNLKDSINKYSTQYLNGSINPISNIGKVGDFYINTKNYKLFGPKKSAGWIDSVSLIGPQGPAGSSGSNVNNLTLSNNSTNNFSSVSGMSVPNFLNYFGNGVLGNVSVSNNATLANNSMYKNLTIASGVTAFVSPSVRTVIYVSDTLFLYGTIDGSGQAGAATVSNATLNHLGASATGFYFYQCCSYTTNGFSNSVQPITWEANTMSSTFFESLGGSFKIPSGPSSFSGIGLSSPSNYSGVNMTADILKRFLAFGPNISGCNGSSIANAGSGPWSRNGGTGGAGLYIMAKNVVFTGMIKLNGGDGAYGAFYPTSGPDKYPGVSGAGGGGSCILRSEKLISQTGTFQSNGGNMVINSVNIGNAGNGAMLIIK